MQTTDTRRRTLNKGKEDDTLSIPSRYARSGSKSYWKRRIRRRERRAGTTETRERGDD